MNEKCAAGAAATRTWLHKRRGEIEKRTGGRTGGQRLSLTIIKKESVASPSPSPSRSLSSEATLPSFALS